MSEGFTKLYGTRLLNSSLWLESKDVRVLWFAVLAKADEDGFVDCPSIKLLARMANLTPEETEQAVAVLEAPDPDSRTPDHDGRRLERVQGGWQVLNHQAYREIRTSKQIADAKRQAKRRRGESQPGATERDSSHESRDESHKSRDESPEAEIRDQKTEAEDPPLTPPVGGRVADRLSGGHTQTVADTLGAEATAAGWSAAPELTHGQLRKLTERALKHAEQACKRFDVAARDLVRAGLAKARAHGQPVVCALLEAEPGVTYQPKGSGPPRGAQRPERAKATTHENFAKARPIKEQIARMKEQARRQEQNHGSEEQF